jgi:hypothetical protein
MDRDITIDLGLLGGCAPARDWELLVKLMSSGHAWDYSFQVHMHMHYRANSRT